MFNSRGSVQLDRDIFNPKIIDKTHFHIEDGASKPDIGSIAGGHSSVMINDSHESAPLTK